jgi:uncharacterized protein (TIGR00730 family)
MSNAHITRRKTITVYLGSSARCRNFFKDEAEKLGALIAADNQRLIYGGMDAGLMGLLANAVLRGGAPVTGIIPRQIKDILVFHNELTEDIIVDTLWERKRLLFSHGDVLAAFPGGFGTLDEILEVLYWAQLGLHSKPIVFINLEGYWDKALAHLKALPNLPDDLYFAVDHCEDLLPAIAARQKNGDQLKTADNDDLPHCEDEIVRATKTPLIVNEFSLEETYRLVTALGLKQVAASERPLGLLNRDGQYNHFLAWMNDALREKFITNKCPQLMAVAPDEQSLMAELETREDIVIDLMSEKWGVSAAIAADALE